MPITGTVPVTAKIAPTNALDTYPTHDEQWGLGGYRSVADTTERDAISADRRNEGMLVHCRDTGIRYKLGAGLGNGDWAVDGSGGGGSGTVTSVSVTTANGVSGSVATATTTPAITLTLGAITPSSVNSVVLSGASTPTLAVTGTTTVSGTHSGTSSGTNTGDQLVFKTISVSGQSDVVADTTTDTLTLVAGSNVTITTDATTDSITIASTAGGSGDVVGPASATDSVPALFNGTTGKLIKNSTPTGTGNPVLATSPTLVTPALGTPSSGTLTSCTGLPISTGVSGLGTGVATFLGTPSSANLLSALTDETGTGLLVFATSPTLTTPLLGTPTSGTLTNCTGLPVSTGISGLGTGIATFLATPSSANLASAITDETGTAGSLVFSSAPTMTGTVGVGDLMFGGDTPLVRNAANDLWIRNGATAMSFAVTNTYTSSTSYEVGRFFWSGNTLVVGTDKGSGGGSIRAMSFFIGGSSVMQLDTSGNLIPIGGSNVRSIGLTASRMKDGFFQGGIAVGASGADATLTAEGSGILQLGSDSATAAAQVLKGPDGSGSDKVGGNLSLKGGQPTGLARGGDLITQTGLSGTTGSSVGSYSTRHYESAKWVDLTEATATTLFTVTVGTGKYIGIHAVCTVNALDATDFQTQTSIVMFGAVNKAGTITLGTVTQTDSAVAASAGTLTPVTYTITDNGSGVLALKCAATSSLTQTQLRCKWIITALNSDDVATVTPT